MKRLLIVGLLVFSFALPAAAQNETPTPDELPTEVFETETPFATSTDVATEIPTETPTAEDTAVPTDEPQPTSTPDPGIPPGEGDRISAEEFLIIAGLLTLLAVFLLVGKGLVDKAFDAAPRWLVLAALTTSESLVRSSYATVLRSETRVDDELLFEVVDELNEYRQKAGLPPIVLEEPDSGGS